MKGVGGEKAHGVWSQVTEFRNSSGQFRETHLSEGQ